MFDLLPTARAIRPFTEPHLRSITPDAPASESLDLEWYFSTLPGSDALILCNASVLDKRISTANFKKLNALVESEGCSADALVTRMIKQQKQASRKPRRKT
jgi:hypothetical protein